MRLRDSGLQTNTDLPELWFDRKTRILVRPDHNCWASLVAQLVKNPPAIRETSVQSLGWVDPLEKGKATHSSILGLPWWLSWYRIRLQFGRPGFNPWIRKIPWRRAWQPTPVFLPGESPWTEEPGGLQSMRWQRVRHD